MHDQQPLGETSKKGEESNIRSNRSLKQDSLEKPETRQVRSSSPRRLIKQVALAESPPDDEPHHFYRGVHSEKKHFCSTSWYYDFDTLITITLIRRQKKSIFVKR